MLRHGRCYRLKTATIAVVPKDDHTKAAEMIPEGAIVRIVDMLPTGKSLSVEWGGKVCEMFKEDLLERGQEVKARSTGERLPF